MTRALISTHAGVELFLAGTGSPLGRPFTLPTHKELYA
jgi:hypothetical protein